LSYNPKPVPLAADLVRREERDDFTVEVVNIHATPAYHIPARVLIPRQKRASKLPAVLALHCHSGRYTWGHEKVLSSPDESPTLTEFRKGTYGRPWAEALVRRGYLVIAIDAFYFGERRLRVEELERSRVFTEVREAFDIARSKPAGSSEWIAATNRVCSFYEHHTAKTIAATGATWPGIHVWDEMRTVDYLLSRPDVDSARIGCVGLSGGGFRTAMAIAADPRIKVASVTGWMTEFAHQLRNHIRHTWMVFVPGLYASLDLPDAAALHAPGALLVQQCRRDSLYPMAGMQGAVDKLARIYAKAGIPERFRGTFYDDTHSFRPAMQEEAFDWLDRWL
jgi:dienelactone hydrolase